MIIQDYFSLITEGNTIADSFTITVTLENGTFNIDRLPKVFTSGNRPFPLVLLPMVILRLRRTALFILALSMVCFGRHMYKAKNQCWLVQ